MGSNKIALKMRQPLAVWECEKKIEMLKQKLFNKDVIEEYATPEYETSGMNPSSSRYRSAFSKPAIHHIDGRTTNDIPETPITVVTFNCQNLCETVDRRIDDIASYLEEQMPFDALCLQEISYANAQELASRLGMKAEGSSTNVTCTTAILLSQECEAVQLERVLRPGRAKSWEIWRNSDVQKYQSVVRFNLRGLTLNVASIHLGAAIGGGEQKLQLANVLQHLMMAQQRTQLPFVATGDTNGVDDSGYESLHVIPNEATYFPACTEHDNPLLKGINKRLRSPQRYDRAYSNLEHVSTSVAPKICPLSDHVAVKFAFQPPPPLPSSNAATH